MSIHRWDSPYPDLDRSNLTGVCEGCSRAAGYNLVISTYYGDIVYELCHACLKVYREWGYLEGCDVIDVGTIYGEGIKFDRRYRYRRKKRESGLSEKRVRCHS